jgi:hypothetical protein
MRHFAITGLLFVVYGPLMTANAQAPDGLLVDVEACVDLRTRQQQLECYESQVQAALGARGEEAGNDEPGPTTASDDSAGDKGTSRRESRAEQREIERRRREADRRQLAADAAVAAAAEAAVAAEDLSYTAGEIVGEIAAFKEVRPDTYVIQLTNGQIWEQTHPRKYLVRVGATVRIRPSSWGTSYRLTDPDVGSFIQVTRTK